MSTIKVDTIQTRTGSGNITVSNTIAGNLTGNVTGNVTGNLTGTGNSTVAGTLTSTGLITASAGVAIGGTGAVNTLDDFEEGTWAPTLSFTNGNGSYAFNRNVASYVKVGRMVHIQIFSELSTKSGASGNCRISNWPFVPQNVTNGFQFGFVAFNNMATTGAYNGTNASMFGQFNPGDGTFKMYVSNGSGSIVQLDAAHMTNTTQFRINLTYETDS